MRVNESNSSTSICVMCIQRLLKENELKRPHGTAKIQYFMGSIT